MTERLSGQRNRNWIPKIESYLHSGQTYFVVVGRPFCHIKSTSPRHQASTILAPPDKWAASYFKNKLIVPKSIMA